MQESAYFIFGFLLVSAITVLGCAGTGSVAPTPNVQSHNGLSPPVVPKDVPCKIPPKPPVVRPIIAVEKVTIAQSPPLEACNKEFNEDEFSRKIVIPRDEDFFSTKLHKKDSSRYRRWRQKMRIRVGKSHLDTAQLTGGEKYLVVMSNMEGTVRVYERTNGKLVGNYNVEGFSQGSFERGHVIAWTPLSDKALFLAGNKQGLRLYDALTGELVSHLDKTPTWHMRWSKDGRVLATVQSYIPTQSSIMSMYLLNETNKLEKLTEIRFKNRVDDFALSADNRFLAITTYPDDKLELIDLHTGESLWTAESPYYSNSIDFSPDSSKIAIGGKKLVILSIENPSVSATYEKFGNNIHKIRFSPSGDAIAVSAYDGHLRIISVNIEKPKLRLIKDLRHNGTANVYEVEFLRDGSAIISSSGDKTIRQWGKN